ncbi:hypothetical protein GCM10023093_31730 [Nemorincola caseinilytica]|uniref:Lipoprotein n=1 Tax=Nemorincola caseinilytica TaxID=2054315 RepID=A0ABP8NPU3_9BACT
MKKSKFSMSRGIATVAAIVVSGCLVAWGTPSLTEPDKDKAHEKGSNAMPAKTAEQAAPVNEEMLLVQQLEQDGLINQMNGFVVEKRKDMLFIDGIRQPDEVANKYLSTLKKEEIRVQVFSFRERMRQHPEAGFMQVLLPVMFSSPCVQSKPKEGC